jgi:hypothetical protein
VEEAEEAAEAEGAEGVEEEVEEVPLHLPQHPPPHQHNQEGMKDLKAKNQQFLPETKGKPTNSCMSSNFISS